MERRKLKDNPMLTEVEREELAQAPSLLIDRNTTVAAVTQLGLHVLHHQQYDNRYGGRVNDFQVVTARGITTIRVDDEVYVTAKQLVIADGEEIRFVALKGGWV